MATMSLGFSCSSNIDSNDETPVVDPQEEVNISEVSDVRKSDCLSKTRSTWSQILVLTKEDDVISCELQNYSANCGVSFDVDSEYRTGKGKTDSLYIDVKPIIGLNGKDCYCSFNVYFTIHNVKADSFFLHCWCYTGMVSFKESNQVTLEFSHEYVTIDGSRYIIYKPGQQAMLFGTADSKDEFVVPSVINYEGKEYTVTSVYTDAYIGKDLKKLVFSKSIRDYSYPEHINLFNARCTSLENIEVEQGNRLLSSVEGVLYSGNHKTLYCHPGSNKRTAYTVIGGVETIGQYAFTNCSNLKSIRLPESVTTIEPFAFYDCENLESIYIPGKVNWGEDGYWVFCDMKSAPIIYVPESEVEYVKTIYKGTVLPIKGS